eukprot:TRINITY_DN30838_c0_g1_i1.p1 TRINITY_DN30838_c0_g1~~TRINITY_DN30838_c0_g1_i1.p1  ORF type:complete len:160 (-),score=38.17 TRINITY_DN30838_c0_g1_i1:49-528(-)
MLMSQFVFASVLVSSGEKRFYAIVFVLLVVGIQVYVIYSSVRDVYRTKIAMHTAKRPSLGVVTTDHGDQLGQMHTLGRTHMSASPRANLRVTSVSMAVETGNIPTTPRAEGELQATITGDLRDALELPPRTGESKPEPPEQGQVMESPRPIPDELLYGH